MTINRGLSHAWLSQFPGTISKPEVICFIINFSQLRAVNSTCFNSVLQRVKGCSCRLNGFAMVVSIDVKHVFKYPLPLVADTHLSKYSIKKDNFVEKVEVIEQSIDWTKGINYKKRLAFCQNVIPNLLRKLSILNENHLILQEESWLNMNNNQLKLKSHNVTWSKYANMWEESRFTQAAENPQWTLFEQHGHIDIHSFGFFGSLLETFANKFLHYNVSKTLKVMEEILHERANAGLARQDQ